MAGIASKDADFGVAGWPDLDEAHLSTATTIGQFSRSRDQ
jgi:hypothetical protein